MINEHPLHYTQNPCYKFGCILLVHGNWVSHICCRLWCGYEAYRAQEEGKMIFIARASNLKQLGAALASTILAGTFKMRDSIFHDPAAPGS